MDSKLTLNIDKELTGKAKIYAKEQGRSLSDLVENYFKFLTRTSGSKSEDLPGSVRSLLGSIPVPDDFDYKRDLSEQLSKKYLND